MGEKCIIKDNNEFYYTPVLYDLLKGHPVSIQTCTEKEKLFLYKANLKHNNYYNYLPFKYLNGKAKIIIVCPIHGKFKQSIEGHLFGNQCPKCNKVGFSKQSWINKVKNKNCIFYVLEMYDKNESFIKIGITSRSVKERYKNLKEYKYKIIDEISGNSEFIYNIEKFFIKEYKKFKTKIDKNIAGKTECFNKNILENYEQFKTTISEKT